MAAKKKPVKAHLIEESSLPPEMGEEAPRKVGSDIEDEALARLWAGVEEQMPGEISPTTDPLKKPLPPKAQPAVQQPIPQVLPASPRIPVDIQQTAAQTASNVQVPIWEDQSNADGYYRLKVTRQMPDGERHDLGYLPADAGQEVLISTFKKSGVYLVMPVDQFGRASRGEPYKMTIPEDHPLLIKLRAEGSMSSGSVSAPGMGMDPSMVAFLQKTVEDTLKAAREQVEALKASVERERADLASERDRIAKERLSIASQTAGSAIEIQTKLIDRDQQRADHAQQSLVQMLSAQRESEVSRIKSQQDTERTRAEMQMKQMEMNQQQIIARIEAAAKSEEARLERYRLDLKADGERKEKEYRQEREEERKRREEDRKSEAEREERRLAAERESQERREKQEREHYARLLEIQKERQNPLGGLDGMVKLIDTLQTKLPTVFGNNGEPAEPKGFVEVLGQVVVKGIEAFQKQAEITAKLQGLEEEELPEEPVNAGPAQIPAGSPGAPGQPAPVPQQSQQSSAAQADPRAAATRNAAERATKLDPEVAKKARQAIRKLAPEILKMPEGDRIQYIMAALNAEPAIGSYMECVGIRTALIEGGVDVGVSGQIITTLDSLGVVPQHVPRH